MSKLVKNSFIYTIGMLVPKLSQFILLPIYTRYLSPSDYGILSSVQIINTILVLLYTLALDKAIFRLYFDFKTEKEKKDYLGTLFIGISISVVLVTGIIFSMNDIIGSIYKNISFYPYMSLSILASALSTFFLIPQTAFFVKEEATKYILLSLLIFFITNAFIIFYVIILKKGVVGYLQGQLIGNAVLMPVFFFITLKLINLRFVKSLFRKSLRFSLPLLPMTLSAWIMTWSDRIFIERNFDTHDVGIYSLGYKIAMVIIVFSNSFYKAYNPYYFKIAATKSKNQAIKTLRKTNTFYLLIVIMFCSLISLFAKEAIRLLFDSRYFEAYKIVGIIGLSYIFGQSMGIFNLAIYQSKKTITIMAINIAGAILNIILNFLLIQKYGAYGAAWATAITYIVLFGLSYLYARKYFYASYNKIVVYSLFIFMLTINVAFYFLNFNVYTSVVLKIGILILVSLFIWMNFKNQLKVICRKVI